MCRSGGFAISAPCSRFAPYIHDPLRLNNYGRLIGQIYVEGTKFRKHIHDPLSPSLPTESRDEQVTRRFLTKAVRRPGSPENLTIDASEANAQSSGAFIPSRAQ